MNPNTHKGNEMKLDININFGRQRDELPAFISFVKTSLGKIMQKNNEIENAIDAADAKIDGFSTQMGKIGAEVNKLLAGAVDLESIRAKLKANADKLEALGTAITGVDDLNPDGTPVDDGGDIGTVTPV